MASFYTAILTVLKHEGIYSDHPDDPGGATKYGISLRYLTQSNQGDFDFDGDIDIEDVKRMSVQDAKKIYRNDWWDKHNYGRVHSQVVATKIFDLAVNMGSKQAHKIVQRAIWSTVGVANFIKDDGVFGPVTMKSINDVQGEILLPAIRSEAAGFYRFLNRPNFIKGWLNRAYS